MYHICCCCCYQTGTGKTNRTEKEKVSNKIYGKFSSGQCCMFQRKFIKVAKKIYFVLCVIQMRGTQRGRWDKKRWRRRERKETSVLCSGGKQKWATTSSSNTFCNLRQMHFAIWDKCILQFETNMYSPVETGKVTFWCFSPRELFGFFFNLGSFTVPLLEVAFSTRGVHRAHIIWVFVLSK